MKADVRQFGESLGEKAIAQDWAGVHALLAPWLREEWSVDEVKSFFEDDYRATLDEYDESEMEYPEIAEVDAGEATLDELVEAGYPIDEAVTADNFRQWLTLQLQCSDEQLDRLDFDYFSELWCVVVELPEGLRVGYWCHDPDETWFEE